MTPAIVYIFPATAGEQHVNYALRFIQSYNTHPPAIDHQTIIVLNNATVTAEIECMFSSLRNVTFLERDGSAMDIGGYQAAALRFPCDLMAFFGGSTYFKGEGWLLRMVSAYLKHGPALYGVMANKGNSTGAYPHIRTTGFWCEPRVMNEYPHRITKNEQRYPFEHGRNCLTSWVKSQGMKPWLVSWQSEYSEPEWDNCPDGFHRGTQSAMLCGDRLSEPPYYTIP